jgi:hypothetical protein
MYISKDGRNAFNDPLAKNASLWIIYVTGFLLLAVAPDDWSDRFPALDLAARGLSSVIPSIDKWVEFSTFPQQTRLFFTYCWLVLPLELIIIVRHRRSEDGFVSGWRASPKGKYIKPLLLFTFCATILFINVNFAIVDTPPCRVCVNSSKFSQALIGGLLPFVNAGVIASIFWWMRNFRQIYFDDREADADVSRKRLELEKIEKEIRDANQHLAAVHVRFFSWTEFVVGLGVVGALVVSFYYELTSAATIIVVVIVTLVIAGVFLLRFKRKLKDVDTSV